MLSLTLAHSLTRPRLSPILRSLQSYIDRTLLPPAAAAAPRKKQKQKASLQSTMSVLLSSAKIRSVAALVVSYGLCHRLFEVCWKGQLRALYPSAEQFGAALGDVGTWTGIVTICSMLTARAQHAR